MIIYHGNPSKPSLAKCRELAPSYTHGAEFSDKTGRRKYDNPYIIDNGAFAAFKNDEDWDPDEFREMLEWVETNPYNPDFVVIPDVVGDAEKTFERGREWYRKINHSVYQPVQDGMDIKAAIDFATTHGAEGLFIGGTTEWKRKTAHRWVETAHRNGLKAHIARPWDLKAAEQLGADSVDTTTVVAWGAWDKLKALEQQTTLI